MLHRLKVSALEVRSLEDLSKVDRLIVPGGESTVISKFLRETGVGREIVKRARDKERPLAVFGTCAGAIVIATRVTGKNAPESLKLIDITIERNAYGSQRESFEALLSVKGLKKPLPASFIRAPKITRVGRSVEVLAEYGGAPVLVREGNVMVSTFHTEVRGETKVHEMFLTLF